MSDKVCGNCGGTWRGYRCLDCGATLAEIAASAEDPGGPATDMLNQRRRSLQARGGRIIHGRNA
jgi:hypothetical protein